MYFELTRPISLEEARPSQQQASRPVSRRSQYPADFFCPTSVGQSQWGRSPSSSLPPQPWPGPSPSHLPAPGALPRTPFAPPFAKPLDSSALLSRGQVLYPLDYPLRIEITHPAPRPVYSETLGLLNYGTQAASLPTNLRSTERGRRSLFRSRGRVVPSRAANSRPVRPAEVIEVDPYESPPLAELSVNRGDPSQTVPAKAPEVIDLTADDEPVLDLDSSLPRGRTFGDSTQASPARGRAMRGLPTEVGMSFGELKREEVFAGSVGRGTGGSCGGSAGDLTDTRRGRDLSRPMQKTQVECAQLATGKRPLGPSLDWTPETSIESMRAPQSFKSFIRRKYKRKKLRGRSVKVRRISRSLQRLLCIPRFPRTPSPPPATPSRVDWISNFLKQFEPQENSPSGHDDSNISGTSEESIGRTSNSVLEICVSNIPLETEAADVSSLISAAGFSVLKTLIKIRRNGKPKGVAVVWLNLHSSRSEANHVLKKLKGLELGSQKLAFSLPRTAYTRKPQHSSLLNLNNSGFCCICTGPHSEGEFY